MKFFVKPTLMAIDENTIAQRGVNYVDEDMEPLLASRIEEKCTLFPESIEMYNGDDEGRDIRGTRKKKAEVKAVEEMKAKTKKKKEAKLEDTEKKIRK